MGDSVNSSIPQFAIPQFRLVRVMRFQKPLEVFLLLLCNQFHTDRVIRFIEGLKRICFIGFENCRSQIASCESRSVNPESQITNRQ